jgi:hypothetical protein
VLAQILGCRLVTLDGGLGRGTEQLGLVVALAEPIRKLGFAVMARADWTTARVFGGTGATILNSRGGDWSVGTRGLRKWQ